MERRPGSICTEPLSAAVVTDTIDCHKSCVTKIACMLACMTDLYTPNQFNSCVSVDMMGQLYINLVQHRNKNYDT